MSDAIELLGLACIVAAAALLGGLAAALFVAGLALLLVGWSLRDVKLTMAEGEPRRLRRVA